MINKLLTLLKKINTLDSQKENKEINLAFMIYDDFEVY